MQDHVSQNLDAFRAVLPSMLAKHRGQHALIHAGEVVGLFLTSLEAIAEGYRIFGEGQFSVEPVDDIPEDLGFFSHVSAALHA